SPGYEGTFQVQLVPARPEVRILTTAEVREKSCILVSHFHCQSPLGNPGPIQIMLRNFPGDEVRFEFPQARPAGMRRLGADYHWELTFPPGTAQPIVFQLRARIPVRDFAKLALPEVNVAAAQNVERWLAVTGPELRLENQHGLAMVQDPGKELPI